MMVIPRLLPQKRKKKSVGIITNGVWTPSTSCYTVALKITVPVAC